MRKVGWGETSCTVIRAPETFIDRERWLNSTKKWNCWSDSEKNSGYSYCGGSSGDNIFSLLSTFPSPLRKVAIMVGPSGFSFVPR